MAKKPTLNLMDETRHPAKTIFLLAWPVFLEQIFTTLVSYADTAMVGGMGKAATAAVSISNPVIFLLNGVVMSLGIGITSLVARAVGAGENDKVKLLMRHAIMAIMYIGIPICLINIALHRMIPMWMGAEPDVLEYAATYNLIVAVGRFFNISAMILNSAFRGYGDTKTPLVVNTLMNVINVCFNFLLIYPTRMINVFGFEFEMYGAGLGITGAAIATSIGMTVSGAITLYIAFFRKNEYRIDLKGSWKIDKPLTKQIFKISLPAMLERLFMSSSGIFVNSSIALLGTTALAANSLCLTAESISFMPAFAFQTAATTLVGQSLGAEKPKLAEKFVKTSIILGSILMFFAGIGLFVFSTQLIGIFTPDLEVIDLGAQCLKVVAFMQIPQVITWIYAGALRGAGDTKSIFYITASTNWLVRTIPSVIAIRFLGFGLVASQYIIMAEILARLILSLIRYRSGKWKTIFENKA